jgi:Flp pilus assembly protein TadD
VLLEGEPAPPRAEIARLFTAAAALRPDHAHTLVDLGIALLENGELPAGRTVLDRAHAIAPNYPRAWIGLVAARSVAGDTAGALAAARELWRLQPGSPKAAMLLVHALARSGELAEARAVATAQVERAPESAAAAGMLGTLLAEAGALADAIAMLRRAVDLDPTGGAHYYDLGVALQRAGLTAEAEAAYRQAIERNPGFAEAHCNLAAVLQQRGAFDAALIALRRGDALGRARPSWSYPSQLWLAELEARIARLPKLDRIVAGEAPPSDPQELNDLAAIALARGDALLSLRLFEAVEGAAPATGPGRLDAARAAARVASAPAELAVPTAEVRARAHRFGVRRLRGLFGELEAAVAADTNLAGVRRELEAWLLVSDFAPLREAAGGSLDPERLAWVALFDEVRALRAALADR